MEGDSKMKLNSISAAILTVTAIGVMATCASAQVLNTPTTSVQNPFSVKVGVMLPSNGSSKHVGGSDQLSIGVDYALAKTTDENPSLPSVYFDYTGGQRSNNGHIDSFGVGVAVRSLTTSATSKMSPFVGAGAGIYYTNGNQNGSTKSNYGIGGKIFVGENIGGSFFVEGNYQFLPGVNGINPSGFGLQGGVRF
jgi:hypothetical protein